MHDLMSIGRFADLAGLSAKTLRRYDRLGILRPAVVDLATGYRYYQRSQIERAERIRQLRVLDMPLREIKEVLDTENPATIRHRLAAQRQRLVARMGDDQRAIQTLRVLERAQSDHREETMMDVNKSTYGCSFCGKPNEAVERLIAGPNGVFICNECVEQCNEILARETKAPVLAPHES